MAKLTEKEREGFEKILGEDLSAINVRFMNQIKDFWGIARKKVLEEKGWDKLIEEKERLEIQKKEILSEYTLLKTPLIVSHYGLNRL